MNNRKNEPYEPLGPSGRALVLELSAANWGPLTLTLHPHTAPNPDPNDYLLLLTTPNFS
jgi:hypothetical protein